jgi:hypothetical protein
MEYVAGQVKGVEAVNVEGAGQQQNSGRELTEFRRFMQVDLPRSPIFQAATAGATVVIPAAGAAAGGSLKAWSTRHFSPSSKR